MENMIGSKIRELRCSRNLTQEQLAQNLNITAQSISKWENGIGMPDISQVVPIAHFFDVSTDYLFGIEENTITDEIKKIIDNATAQDSYYKEYIMLKEALKTYPGDVRLLLELLSCGKCLISDGNVLTQQEKTTVFEETERAGKLILSYTKELPILCETVKWLIKLYCEMGETEKGVLLSEMLPELIGFNKISALALVYESSQEYKKAAECYETNIYLLTRELIHSTLICGNMYAHGKNSKKAIEQYTSVIALSQAFMSNTFGKRKKSLEAYLNKSIEYCNRSIEYLKNK